MKKILVTVFMMVLSHYAFAQSTIKGNKIKIGPKYEVVDAKFKEYFVFDNNLVSVKTNSKGKGYQYDIMVFDKETLALKAHNHYEDFDKEAREEGIIDFNGKLYLFYSIWDEKNEQLFVREIDTENATFKGEGKKLFDVGYKLTGQLRGLFYWSLDVHYKFKFETSIDDKKLLVRYQRRWEKDTHKEKIENKKTAIGYKLLDTDLNVIVGNDDIELPYDKEHQFDDLSYAVDSNGDLFIATKAYRDDSRDDVIKKKVNGEKIREINYDIEILKIKGATGEISKNQLNLDEGKNITDLNIFEIFDGSLICSGYYSTGGSKGRHFDEINGVFKFDLGDGTQYFKIDYFDIPVETINENMSNRAVKKNNRKEEKGDVAFAHLSPETCFIARDGGIVLIGEQYWIEQRTIMTQNGSYTQTIYHYDHILLTKINKDGSLAWMTKVPKRQTKGYASFRLIEGLNALHVVYVDNINNLKLDKKKVPAPNGKHLTVVTIDYITGEKMKTSLFEIGKVKDLKIYQFGLERIVETGMDEFVIEFYKKKKEDVLVKVNLSK